MKPAINDCYVIALYEVCREFNHGKDELVSIRIRIVQFKKHDHEWSFN